MRSARSNLLIPALIAAAGLTAATVDPTAVFTPAQKKHWAFQKVQRPPAPTVQNAGWVRTPVDAFVLAKLEARGIKPSPEADRGTLLRRVSFDLIGLPPAPDEIEAFVSDKSPNAYEKVVDRLLASPHYGERWARHWLDLARFAESEGFKSDETRPNAWRYRDYVIRAFNSNKPYDRFVKEQIAGDELWPDDFDARVATAFNRHYPDESNARNLMQRRQEILDDITDTTGAVFMGLTYGCARCHNHKFDPILQADYYRLQAFYANTTADDEITLLPADKAREYRTAMSAWEEKTKPIRDEMQTLLAPKKQAILKDFVDKYPPEIQAVIAKPPAERNPYEWQMYMKAKPYLEVDDETAARSLKGEQKQRYQALKSELGKFAALHPGELPTGIGMHDISATAPPTHILKVGVYDNPMDEVEPGFLTLLAPGPAKMAAALNGRSTGRRAALANWLTDPQNPLTPRVMVNRIWHYHFGEGIVGTPSDFGVMGQRPTHPELLDWLATEFVRTDWDMKAMHKLIVMSNTYRQASAWNEASAKEDSRNRLLWRFPRQRLEGEVIRDAALSVAGLLNTKVGGPSVMPELPEGMPAPRGGWKVSTPEDRNRRSVYIFVRRNARYPMLESLDMPDTHESCGRRNKTITPMQALSLLNDKVTLDWARAFAGRVLREAGSDPANQIERAYQLAYSRRPDGADKDTVLTFLAKHRQIIERRATNGGKLAVPENTPDAIEPAHAAALVDFCHMLLNSNEFVYRN
jgi:hypothetical protein